MHSVALSRARRGQLTSLLSLYPLGVPTSSPAVYGGGTGDYADDPRNWRFRYTYSGMADCVRYRLLFKEKTPPKP
ncbi:hypothetical protein ACLK19_00800 [Escherichia coli]